MNKTIKVLEKRQKYLKQRIDLGNWGIGREKLSLKKEYKTELNALSTAIQALKALDQAEKELGEKKVFTEGCFEPDINYQGNCTGFDQLHDIAKPIIAQKDLRIEELLKYEWEMRKQLSYLTPQGSEFTEFEECYNYIKEQLREGHEAKKQVVYERRELQSTKQELSQLKGKLSRESLKKVLENLDSNVVKTSNYYRVRAIQKECGIEEDTNDK